MIRVLYRSYSTVLKTGMFSVLAMVFILFRKTPSPVLITPKEPEKSVEKIGKGSRSHKDLKRFGFFFI